RLAAAAQRRPVPPGDRGGGPRARGAEARARGGVPAVPTRTQGRGVRRRRRPRPGPGPALGQTPRRPPLRPAPRRRRRRLLPPRTQEEEWIHELTRKDTKSKNKDQERASRHRDALCVFYSAFFRVCFVFVRG